MDVAAFIPIKSDSSRIPKKNFQDFHGVPLYEHFFKKLQPDNPFDEVIVNTDSSEVMETADSYGFNPISRPDHLTREEANVNDILLHDANKVDADICFQLFVTAPLLQEKTIEDAYDMMTNERDYDSLFTVSTHNSFFWNDDEPTNYDPKNLPRTQDLDPIYEETTGLYAIDRTSLFDRECRIGYNPEFLEVNEFEAIDVDRWPDLEMARMAHERGALSDFNS